MSDTSSDLSSPPTDTNRDWADVAETFDKQPSGGGSVSRTRKRTAEEDISQESRAKRKRAGLVIPEEETPPVSKEYLDTVNRFRHEENGVKAHVNGSSSDAIKIETRASQKVELAIIDTSKGRKKKVKTHVEEVTEVDAVVAGTDEDVAVKKVRRKRKTKEEKEAEAMPIAARSIGAKLFVGAHVSAAGG